MTSKNDIRVIVGSISACLLLVAVILANYLTSVYGFVPVGFGYEATAGTFAAGFALAARDPLQDAIGRWGMLAVIALAAVVSYFVADPTIALASAVAFAVSELIDFGVYTPLRRRSSFGDNRWAFAVVLSSIVGALVDTVLFLLIAFGAAAVLPALVGQLIGKAYASLIYLVLGKVASRGHVLREPLDAEYS